MPAPTTTLAPLVVTGLSVSYPDRAVLRAVAIAAAPDLLLLDEPTHHVSLALAGEVRKRS